MDKQQHTSDAAEAAKEDASGSLARLKQASSDLKQRIIDQKRRNDLPLDAALGNPSEEAKNADGRNDLPDTEDD